MLAVHLLAFLPRHQQAAFYDVPLRELELAAGGVLPQYGDRPPWNDLDAEVSQLPWAVLDGPGEVVFAHDLEIVWPERSRHALGELLVRTDAARDLAGTLFLPKASGTGFLRIPFRIPASRATASETDFRRAELERYRRLLRARVPGGAWFRHRIDELRAALGPELAGASEGEDGRPGDEFRDEGDTLALFSGGRALYENLQLERGIPVSPADEEQVELADLEGIEVREIDWEPLLEQAEPELDALAGLVPADQHALFFPSFQGLVDVLDEAGRLGEFGLEAFEGRSADAATRQRYERQLCLELSALARALGPLVVESVVLTRSDPYLRSGSDLALLLRARSGAALRAHVAARQDAAAGGAAKRVEGTLAGLAYRGVVEPARSVSSYLAMAGETAVVTNSLVQLERIALVAAGKAPALSEAGEYRFFRQRYVPGAEGESAFLVLPDAAIRRWCSPRWRIACARIARAAAALAEEQAQHLGDLLADVPQARELGYDPDFPGLGALRLTSSGVHSPLHGTLDFLTPVAELPLEKVTAREAELYRTWRAGYEQAWSNFFDPIAARLVLDGKRTALDLSVRPLILGTEYDDLRELTRGPGLTPGAGDPHPEALVHFALGLDPQWETFRTLGMSLGSSAEKLGADLVGWLGGWVAISLDDSPLWDEVLQAEDVEEALSVWEDQIDQVPIAVTVAVANPLKLALFLNAEFLWLGPVQSTRGLG